MAKRLVVLVGMLMALLTVAVPAFAQEGITPPPGEETVTLSFELIVKGTPPEGTRFFGSAVGEGGPGVPLTDPDGDGIFNGSVTVPKFPPGLRPVPPGTPPIVLPVRIVQVEQGPFGPGELSVIRDFGLIPLDEDKTFSASVSFDGPPPGPAPGTTATFNFELTVKGQPPADARFFGVVPAEGCISAPLTDPDGDGVFTVSLNVPRFAPGGPPEPVSLPVQIVQANSGAGPCNPTTVIKDFGIVPANDNTFRAQVNFGFGGPGGSGSIGSGNSSGGGTGKLPSTGGAIPGAIPALGLVSALLVGGGLLIRRVTR